MSSTQTQAALPPQMPMPRERGLILKNLADFQTELARVSAGFIPGMEDWAMRNELPLHVFSDLRMVQDLRVRHKELGVAPGDIHLSQAVPAREMIELLCEAPSSADALEAIYALTKGHLATWIREGMQSALGVYDLPSTPLLEANVELLQKQIAWAAKGRAALGGVDQGYLAKVKRALEDLGDALSNLERRRAEPVRRGRRVGRLPLLDGATPRGFAPRATIPPEPTEESPYADRERFFAMNFLQEVQASDSCASILFEAPDMPWDFYFDAARHMWDESRHSMFGQLKLTSLGIPVNEVALSTTAYRLRQTIAPHDRYAALTTQEADAFPGKHKGLKAALENNDAVGAMTWSYDIADETQHVRYGQKWLPTLIKAMEDPRSPDQVRADAENWRATVLTTTYRSAAQAVADNAPRVA
jgi:hypothetical protein